MSLLSELFEECISQDYIDVDSSSFAVKQKGDTLTLYFEGSRGEVDWIRNFDFLSAPYRDMNPEWQAHRGFIMGWKNILPYIEEYRDNKSIKNVTVVGYSHGAAMAVLAHEDFYFHRPDIRHSLRGVGFAPPRVVAKCCLSPELSVRWENFTSVCNYGDLVVMLPPAFLGYTHVGKMLWIGERGKYTPIEAHSIQSYRTELKNL